MARNRKLSWLAAALTLIACFGDAFAQTGNTTGLVVATCGTPPNPFVAGRPGPFTIDVNGNLCTGTSGGGGASDVNVSEIGGNPVVTGGVNGLLAVGGNVAAGAADTGNPVKVGGVYNSTLPTLANGQRGNLQVGTRGSLHVELWSTDSAAPISSVGAGADGQSNALTTLLSNSWGYLFNGTSWDRARSISGAQAAGTGTVATAIAPTSAAAAAITPTVTAAAANNLVLKASAGNLYSVYATNETATPGFLLVLNATTAPADGAVAPLECVALPANGSASVALNPGPPARFSTGIVAVVSSGANCFTKTTGTITGFIKGMVQ